MFNVAIIGGDETEDYNFFTNKCIGFLSTKAKNGEPITILSTGDKFVEDFSNRFRIDRRDFYCDWKRYGKDAIKIRNSELLKHANGLIYFAGERKEPLSLYNYAKMAGVNCRIVRKNQQ